MVFVAIVLGCLGVMIIAGFVGLHMKMGSLADELRDARARDAHDLATQLDGVADKLHGLRLDVTAHRRSLDDLTLEVQGPPSLRRPPVGSSRSTGG
jgi:hypothetical protein